MPPRRAKAAKPLPRPPAAPSGHREIITLGSRQLVAKHSSRLDANGFLPSTSRALVLRNGKQGAMGTGELMSLRKPIGREKLDLLGEDLVTRSMKNALAPPFNIERLLNTADAEYGAHLDDVKWLKDPDLCYQEISKEVHASVPRSMGSTIPDPLTDRNIVINVIGTRVHNSYMLASAWRIVRDLLELLEHGGIVNRQVRLQLAKNPNLRAEYLAVCDVLGALVDALQARFSLLATTAEHFRIYFKKYEDNDPENPEYMFDWAALRAAYKSYVDSIVIELCLPNSQYPKYILARILEDATQEAPREKERFPQSLFDALGDLSVALQLQEILEAPLLGPQGEQWRKQPRSVPEEFTLWVEAQSLSEEASKRLGNNLGIIFPLERTKNKDIVNAMWVRINDTYKAVTKLDLDTLWQVEDEFLRVPHWSAIVSPDKQVAGASKTNSNRAAAHVRDCGGSEGSMPGLVLSTDASDDDSVAAAAKHDDDSEDEASDLGGEEQDEYDSEEEAELQDLEREVMDIASEHPEIFDEKKAFEERSNDNHLLKALGALRGRLFSSNPRLKTNRLGTRAPVFASKKSNDAQVPDGIGRKGLAPTIEDVEDEDAPATVAKKKKKKKHKKKKKPSPVVEEQDVPVVDSPPPSSPVVQSAPPVVSSPVEKTPPPTLTPATPTTKKKNPEKRRSTTNTPSLASSTSTAFANVSTVSLEQPRAQSAHSYLQSENLAEQKVKVKKRADSLSLPPVEETDSRRSFFSRFRREKEAPRALEEEAKQRQNIGSWFQNLNRKSTGFLTQILGADKSAKKGGPPMKWDHFVKVMIDMGFEVDASTAGSSVRFQPPDPAVRSISFHKPHPGNTIDPITLQKWGKKLKSYYGWSEEILTQHANEI